MATERVRFKGDPIPGETGVPGSEPQIPLNRTVAPISEQKLVPDDDSDDEELDAKEAKRRAAAARNKQRDIEASDDDDDEDEPDELPAYQRERIGSRIGEPMDQAKTIDEVEQQLDNDDVVPLLFPHQVRVQHQGIMHIWEAGVHLVPVSLAGRDKKSMHWYLKHNKVRRAGAAQKRMEPEEA